MPDSDLCSQSSPHIGLDDMAAPSKRERIEKELARISVYFEQVDANQRAMAQPLLQNAAFMAITLQDLQEAINAEGVTDTYRNGATQYGTKCSASLQAYNTTVKNYAAVIKTLAQLLPKGTSGGIKELEQFIMDCTKKADE